MDRFKFNPDILIFQKVRPSGKQKTLRFMGFALFTLSMSLWVLHIRDMHLESPRVEQLIEQQEITQFQLELMNKEMAEQEQILEKVAHNDDQIYRVSGIYPKFTLKYGASEVTVSRRDNTSNGVY